MEKPDYKKETARLGKYLIGKIPTEKESSLYSEAMNRLNIVLDKKEENLWSFMMKNSWSIGCVDGALALKNPDSLIRKKIFVMLAILETSTENTKYFLPMNFGGLYFMKIVFAGVRSIFRAMVGIILISLI